MRQAQRAASRRRAEAHSRSEAQASWPGFVAFMMAALVTSAEPAEKAPAMTPIDAVRELGALGGTEVTLEGMDFSGLPRPGPGVGFAARRVAHASGGPGALEIRATVHGREAGRRIYVLPRAPRALVVPIRPIERGELVLEADLAIERVEAGSTEDFATEIMQIAGRIARRPLPEGQAVAIRHVQAPIVVRRAERVIVRVVGQSFTVTMEGKASENGAAGDRIRVVNAASGQMITARVVGPGVVLAEVP